MNFHDKEAGATDSVVALMTVNTQDTHEHAGSLYFSRTLISPVFLLAADLPLIPIYDPESNFLSFIFHPCVCVCVYYIYIIHESKLASIPIHLIMFTKLKALTMILTVYLLIEENVAPV